MPYMIYAGVLSFLHNAWLFSLEALAIRRRLVFRGQNRTDYRHMPAHDPDHRVLFSRKQKFRTNTALIG